MKLKTYTSPKFRLIPLDNQHICAGSDEQVTDDFATRKMDWEDAIERPYGFHSDNYWEE